MYFSFPRLYFYSLFQVQDHDSYEFNMPWGADDSSFNQSVQSEDLPVLDPEDLQIYKTEIRHGIARAFVYFLMVLVVPVSLLIDSKVELTGILPFTVFVLCGFLHIAMSVLILAKITRIMLGVGFSRKKVILHAIGELSEKFFYALSVCVFVYLFFSDSGKFLFGCAPLCLACLSNLILFLVENRKDECKTFMKIVRSPIHDLKRDWTLNGAEHDWFQNILSGPSGLHLLEN